jgi:hypothetical protein
VFELSPDEHEDQSMTTHSISRSTTSWLQLLLASCVRCLSGIVVAIRPKHKASQIAAAVAGSGNPPGA